MSLKNNKSSSSKTLKNRHSYIGGAEPLESDASPVSVQASEPAISQSQQLLNDIKKFVSNNFNSATTEQRNQCELALYRLFQDPNVALQNSLYLNNTSIQDQPQGYQVTPDSINNSNLLNILTFSDNVPDSGDQQ